MARCDNDMLAMLFFDCYHSRQTGFSGIEVRVVKQTGKTEKIKKGKERANNGHKND